MDIKPLITADEIDNKLAELGKQITEDYAGKDVLLVGVLRGAFMVMADLARHIDLPVEFDFMAVSSYGASTQTSGVVRILKDLDEEIDGRHVLIVEDIIDSGLTLNYLMKSLNVQQAGISRDRCAIAQGGHPASSHRRQIRWVSDRPRVRCRIWPGLRRQIPQPSLRRCDGRRFEPADTSAGPEKGFDYPGFPVALRSRTSSPESALRSREPNAAHAGRLRAVDHPFRHPRPVVVRPGPGPRSHRLSAVHRQVEAGDLPSVEMLARSNELQGRSHRRRPAR